MALVFYRGQTFHVQLLPAFAAQRCRRGRAPPPITRLPLKKKLSAFPFVLAETIAKDKKIPREVVARFSHLGRRELLVFHPAENRAAASWPRTPGDTARPNWQAQAAHGQVRRNLRQLRCKKLRPAFSRISSAPNFPPTIPTRRRRQAPAAICQNVCTQQLVDQKPPMLLRVNLKTNFTT